MGKYVNTDFAILIHDDVYCKSDSWKDEFLEYDYVGAPGEYLIITTHTEI
jgi:hypothetical protein